MMAQVTVQTRPDTPLSGREPGTFAANAGAPLLKAVSYGQPPVTFHAGNVKNQRKTGAGVKRNRYSLEII